MKTLILLLTLLTGALHAQEYNQTDANGQKHGPWRGTYPDTGHLKYEGTFEHGKEVGTFTFYDNTKDKKIVATRQFTPGKDEAYTIIYNGKYKVSEGYVRNREYDGEWKYYHYNSEQIMTLEPYRNGQLHGVRKVFYQSGKIAEEATYENGIKQGPYKKYSENGVVLEEATFLNDQYHGPYTLREADDKIILKGQYKNGKSVGIWQHFKDGKVTKEENFDEKKAVKPKKGGPRKRAKLNVKEYKP